MDQDLLLEILQNYGYNLLGWSINPESSIADFTPGEEITVSERTILYAIWKLEAPKRDDLYGILRKFVKVHCVANGHDDKLYSTFGGTFNGLYESTVGDVYYSEEQKKYLCDVTLNGEVYNYMYKLDPSFGVGEGHYLVKDNNFNEPAIYDEDTKKTITLYYDEEAEKWRKPDNLELPIIFNVKCIQAVNEGYYKVKHEYYLKDKNNNLILEGTEDIGETTVLLEDNEVIKVGIFSEEERVDIEVEKKPKYSVNNIEYEYFENSGSIIIEKDVVKEITLKYVREIQEENEVKIKVEKIWEDENNKYSKRPESIVLQIKNGEEVIAEMEVSEENSWSSEFVVPKYDKDGNEIKYTVDEKETNEFYEKTIDGYKVINKYIGEESKDENNNEIVRDEENVDTSDINIWIYMSIVIISIIVITIIIILVKKNNKNSK